MTAPTYITDAERAYRPSLIRSQYRFWLRFTIGRKAYCRWFDTPESRQRFLHELPPHAMIFDQGEEDL